ncbi:RNA polymerase factor sigma-54 [Porphyromonas sp.]|uniref:RNA polymerase factor sigma-54 n=1 Tax=Porphyromonas sp. TaxID=1924944 RepID=UPI0026DCFE28|nr:RNA polymerase factor sigma-54 [Porphyromonas sp.]MDO4771577.1 RNA polymerase factor sigma-54 [Porphyromonas sp.]
MAEHAGTLKQKLAQRLSTRQVQLMQMITLPITELEQRIKEELEDNPALEEGVERQETDAPDNALDEAAPITEEEMVLGDYADIDDVPDYKLRQIENASGISPTDIPFADEESLQENLRAQLLLTSLSEAERKVAEFVIGSLDDDGLLRRDPESLLDDLAIYHSLYIDREELAHIESVLRTLDPPGICARSVRECLSIQLKRRQDPTPVTLLAQRIIDEHFDLFAAKAYDRLQTLLEADEEDLRQAIKVITRLNPSPGLDYTSRLEDSLSIIIPDFFVTEQDGELNVSLNQSDIPDVRVSRDFTDQMKEYTGDLRKVDKGSREAAKFVKQKIDDARWFVDMIRQRNTTLIDTMTAIVQRQREYFLAGDLALLRPMILKDIADMIGADISTISRVTSTKYVQTDFGIFPLKYFFSESATTDDGEEISTHRVRELIAELISAEDKKRPITDDQLSDLLKAEGFTVARRTVAKYRDQLGIPVARLRREL